MVLENKSKWAFFWITIITVLACIIIGFVYSGLYHPAEIFQTVIGIIVLILVIQYVILDPIKFGLLALDTIFWIPRSSKFPKKNFKTNTRLDYLKSQLKTLKSELLITHQHRNELINVNYHYICQELWIYGKYFFILFLLIIVTRDHLMVFNSKFMEEMFMFTHNGHYGLSEIKYITNVYYFIETSLINSFSANNFVGGIGWIHANQTKLMGVIRLRQLRLNKLNLELFEPEFSKLNYMPNWTLPERDLLFKQFYWRVYEPWINQDLKTVWIKDLLLYIYDTGLFAKYPKLTGYMALLTHSKTDSKKLLNFLSKYNWLNYNTSVIYMEFTMYNVDVNIFSICTLRLELTPYGMFIPAANIESYKLLENIDQFSRMGLFVMIVYLFVYLHFCKNLIVKLWFDRNALRNLWNCLDLVLILLNVIIVAMILLREYMVNNIISLNETSSKFDFIDFRRPAAFSELISVTIGFLVAFTTIRLWKVMQFASVFQIFTRTLYSSLKSASAIAAVITILVIAFGIVMGTINGNNCFNFNYLIKSIISCVCFVFGYTSEINPENLYHGGKALGIFIYVIMGFVLAVMLINVFISLIIEYFSIARKFYKRDYVLSFWEFIRVEYSDYWNCFRKICFCNKKYHRHNRTVTQNIDRSEELDLLHRQSQRRSQIISDTYVKEVVDERQNELKYRLSYDRILGISAIMEMQIEILNEILINNNEKEEVDDLTWDAYREIYKGKNKPK